MAPWCCQQCIDEVACAATPCPRIRKLTSSAPECSCIRSICLPVDVLYPIYTCLHSSGMHRCHGDILQRRLFQEEADLSQVALFSLPCSPLWCSFEPYLSHWPPPTRLVIPLPWQWRARGWQGGRMNGCRSIRSRASGRSTQQLHLWHPLLNVLNVRHNGN